ncbi:hypothetical protein Dimus_031604 [Dionaea muscipula]
MEDSVGVSAEDVVADSEVSNSDGAADIAKTGPSTTRRSVSGTSKGYGPGSAKKGIDLKGGSTLKPSVGRSSSIGSARSPGSVPTARRNSTGGLVEKRAVVGGTGKKSLDLLGVKRLVLLI